MEIKVLGDCCKKASKNYDNVLKAVKLVDSNIKVELITDMNEILNLGVMSTPAIIIDDKIVSTGKLLTVDQIVKLIKPCTCGNC